MHHTSCPYIGASTIEKCTDRTLCVSRHEATSMTVGIIAKLSKGFEDVGGKGMYRPTTLQTHPTKGAR